MNYLFDCGGEKISVWVNKYCEDRVSLWYDGKERIRTVHTDDEGKFFTWNRHKIYLDKFLKISKQEIINKLKNNEFVTDDELCQMLLSEGVDNVRFVIPMMTVDCRFMGLVSCNPNKRVDTVCHIEEGFNRMVSDNYMFNFVPDNFDGSTLSHYDIYTSDFVSWLRSGDAKIVA